MGVASSSPRPSSNPYEPSVSPLAETPSYDHGSGRQTSSSYLGSESTGGAIPESDHFSSGGSHQGYGSFASHTASVHDSSGGSSVVSGLYQRAVLPWPQGPPAGPVYGVPVWEDPRHERNEWSTGLCGCLWDIPSCLLGCFCPCIAFGMNAEALDDGMTSCVAAAMVWYLLQQVTLCGCLYSCWYRKKLRSRFNLPERPLPDILVHYCCWPCAICQEYREIQHRSSGPPLLYTTPPEEQTFAERTWHA